MSSILSTQKRHTFLRRKYCFFPAVALSPPVGRMEPLMGLPPLVSAMGYSLPSVAGAGVGSAGADAAGAGGAGAGCAGAGAPGCPGRAWSPAAAGAAPDGREGA